MNRDGGRVRGGSGSGVWIEIAACPKFQSEGGYDVLENNFHNSLVLVLAHTQLLQTTKIPGIQVRGILHLFIYF